MEIHKTIACWSDLLGFGEELNAFDWDLHNDTDGVLISRLVKFASVIIENALGFEKGSFINDGLIRTLDFGAYSIDKKKWMLMTWLDSCLMAHCLVNSFEKDKGLPGVRTVICEGQVINYTPTEESHWRQPFQTVEPILTQLNTALSKCYIADQAGSKGGVKKGSLYIERKIIDHLIEFFDYQLLDDFLVPHPDHMDVSHLQKYQSIEQLYFIKSDEIREEASDACFRVPWFRLGEDVQIVKGNLNIVLTEIVAYSPVEDFVLCWYAPATGLPHGITIGSIPDLEEDLKKIVDNEAILSPHKELVLSVLRNYSSKFIRYVHEDAEANALMIDIINVNNQYEPGKETTGQR